MEKLNHSFGRYELHPHQLTAVQWMKEREDDVHSGGFLCDEMGLGKTLTAVGLMMNKRVARTLILCPLAVVRQWRRTIQLAEGPAVFEIEKSKWVQKGGNFLKGRVFVTNYDKILASPLLFAAPFNRIFLDEAHVLRNHKGKKYKEIYKLVADHRWLLTGTPIVNSTDDFRTLLALIKRDLSPKGGMNLAAAASHMRTFGLARTTEQLRASLSSLIPKEAIVERHRIPFTTEEEAIQQRGIQGKIAAEIEHLMEEDHPNMVMILTLILRLRQISVHPQIQINAKRREGPQRKPDWLMNSSKFEKILDVLRSDSGSHGQVIFCNFKDEVNLLRECLEREESVQQIFTQTSDLTSDQREDVVEASEQAMQHLHDTKSEEVDALLDKRLNPDICGLIQDFIGPKHVVMIAQIHCAGTGVNLQHFDRCIFSSAWWTAALMDQAAGRVLRLGQKKQVKLHQIELQEEAELSLNIDDQMNEKVEKKRLICEQVLEAANHAL